MEPVDLLVDEPRRLAALRELELVGTPPEASYDRLVRLATTLFDVPIALISLVDADRSWFKARVGLDVAEVARDGSFCAHTIAQPPGEPLVVDDTWLDDRFESHPMVSGSPRIRFYAGCTLHAPDGSPIGTIAIVDRQPRTLTSRELLGLADLAALADEIIAARVVATPEDDQFPDDQFQDELPAEATVVDAPVSADSGRVEALELMLEHTSDVIVVVDADGAIKDASASLRRSLGYQMGAATPGGALALVHPDDRSLARDQLKAAVAGTSGDTPFTVRVLTASGSIRNMECTAVSRFDKSQVRGVVVTMRDVSERHMLNQMLRFQSTHDRLTELPNRTLMQEHLRPALARASRERSFVAVCAFDIDGFQELNQQLGHAAGDELLVEVAKRITSTIRNGDSVARLGADEFAVLLDPVANADEAMMVADRIVAAMAGPHSLQAGVSRCGVSAGVALSADLDDANTIINRAGLALLSAKRAGGGRVWLAEQPPRLDELVDSHRVEQQF
ncbi:MAG: diguanylate cyclase [Acidimicrobiales bacterium]